MKAVILLLTVAFGLIGCASSQLKEVQIPIAVLCKTPDPVVPTYRYNPPYTTMFDGVRDLLGDRELSLAYEIELRAALQSCK